VSTPTLILILLALLAANLPWFSNRLFFLIPLRNQPKTFAWQLLELGVLYFLIGFLALAVERELLGQTASQHWEFYAITACMFLVFAFPGFVYRYLWRK
jgi:hypothetical protein